VAPASPCPYQDLLPALDLLRNQWQLNVIEGQTLHENFGAFAGPDDLRRADLQAMLDNPDIQAIWCSRGGYGSYRIVDDLDFSGFIKHPKWLIGFSDITVLLNHAARLGVQSLHAIMPRQLRNPGYDESLETLRQWLFGEMPSRYSASAHPLNRPGAATGMLLGGNLTMITTLLRTNSEPDWRGSILLLEDVDETLFSLDRMMTQLRRTGVLAGLGGLVVGQFSDMRDNLSMPFGQTANEIIAYAGRDYNYPVCFDFPTGHVEQNLALPVGRVVELNVSQTGGFLNFGV
jgi:muramoyltetrapeptide carboxypeptidase